MIRKLRHTFRVGLLIAFCIPGVAAAQQSTAQHTDQQPPGPPDVLSGKSLEELTAIQVESVVGATKHEQRLTEAPSSVTIITARDIKSFGWRTLAEVLQSVRGFHVTYDRNYTYLGVRGFGRPTDYNNRVLVMVDGHRVNDNIYDGVLIGTEFPVDLALIERIEVIRGPGSALYGTSAFFGVINIITKRGATVGREAAVEGGSFTTYRGRASYGWSDGQTRDVLVSLTQHGSGGPGELYFPEFDAPESNGGRVFGRDGDRSTSAYAAATLGRWRFQSLFGTREKEVPTASWSTVFNDERFETTDSRGWIVAGYERSIGAAAVSARGYYDHYGYEGSYPYAETDAIIVGDDSSRMDMVGGEVTVRRTFTKRHAVTFGLEQRNNLRQNQAFFYDGVPDVDDRRSTREFAAFVQDEIALNRRLLAVVGARYDWWSHKGGTGRPRLGLVYHTDYDTAVKVLYGEGYRVPNMYELYYYTSTGSANATRLKPESLRTTELVFEQYLRGRLRLAATGYYTWIRDLVDQRLNEDGEVEHVNNESVRARGVELEAESRWASGVLVRGSFALQEAHDGESQDELSNAPHQLATLQVSVPAWRHQLRFSSDTSFVAWRRTATGERLPGYWLSNVTATYEPVRSPLTIGASLYNLFDSTYAHPVGLEFVQPAIQQDGRTFAVRAGVRF